MSTPKRIQLSRRKGWRLPDYAVSVARPGRWGNPFTVARWGLDDALALFEDTARGIWNPLTLAGASNEDVDEAYRIAAMWTNRIGGHPVEIARADLARRDLACWCRLDQRCHADVLLEIANEGRS
jgi:hypothetical protein